MKPLHSFSAVDIAEVAEKTTTRYSYACTASPKEQPKEIHDADVSVFLQEKDQLWSGMEFNWWNVDVVSTDTESLVVLNMNPVEAKKAFLSTFHSVFGDDYAEL